ncbi:MAG: carboxymuconolactone decarboxylase family protein [Candidatus Methanomethylophilaceae archaeon]|nr:carboxymuconolactone decarboxylase family protein [Candidatus Methanomethylophilaceae archaeon]
MEEDPKEREVADRILEAIKREYGFVPLVNQVMSTRPDIFIPQTRLNKAVFEGKSDLDEKTKYLCAVSAAASSGAEYCIGVHMRHAFDAGATEDEILEAVTIGCQVAMNRAQSYALRRYAEMFDIDTDESYLNNVK